MKVLFIILFLNFIIPSQPLAQIYEPEGLNMPGSWDGWNNPPTVNAIAGIQKTGGTLLPNTNLGARRYTTIISVAASGGDLIGGSYEFLFTSGSSSNYFNNKWGSISVVINSIQNYIWSAAATNNPITIVNGKWYTVNWFDQGYADTKAIFMETSANPVTISSVVDNYSVVGNGSDVTVTVTTSSVKSIEEGIFVRYTTDGWTNWSIVEATTGTNPYVATIPASGVIGTSNNEYYVFTSTLSLATLNGFASGNDIDLSTINFSNNGGLNYPLPVELTSFTASTQGSTVTLNWKTATEVNNYGFGIERSTNSIDNIWKKIGFVEGHGNSNSPKSYSFIDDAVGFNKVFYRLKQIDNDGQFEYSNIVEVDLGIPDKFVLEQNYPNPFNPSTSIKFAFEENTFATLKIYDVTGKEVAELFNGKAESGRVYKLNFNASNLSSGIYFYKLNSGKDAIVKKMLLLK